VPQLLIKSVASSVARYTGINDISRHVKRRYGIGKYRGIPLTGFYPRDAMLARSLRQQRVCLSVRLSHAGIVPSRTKAGS